MISYKDVQNYILFNRRMKKRETIWNICRQSDSLLLTGGAIVNNGYATLIAGPGTDNLLEATYQFPEIDGIIGNGRSILFDTKEEILYSTHFPDEIAHYFKEKFTKRHHKPLMRAKSNNKIIIMNLETNNGNSECSLVEETEVGKNIRISQPSKKRRKIRNFASKACHVRENDLFLLWKEKIPMGYRDIYEHMKDADMIYYTVTTPLYVGRTALMYIELKNGKINPHEHALEKLLDEKII